jgi:Cdc25 family phosphatase
MSAITIANLPRLTRENLAAVIQTSPLNPEKDSKVAVVDVRDSDHVGGHIMGSIHAPAPTLDYRLPELVRELKDKDKVVFHCALSQIRGPSAALRYIRERERLFPVSSEVPAEAAATSRDSSNRAPEQTEEGEEGKASGTMPATKQKVYVLEGGFVQWQEKYGKDERLTDAYDEEVWKYGY